MDLSRAVGLTLKAVTSIFLALLIIGIFKDVTLEKCTGIMGANISCVDYYFVWPFAMLGVPIFAVLVAIFVISRMDRTTSETTKRKTKKRS